MDVDDNAGVHADDKDSCAQVDGGAESDRRNRTLQLLQEYIQKQRALLERTQADITKLQKLKHRAADDTLGTLSVIAHSKAHNRSANAEEEEENEEEENEEEAFGFGKLNELVREMQEEETFVHSIDWGLFGGYDPMPFHDLAASVRNAHPFTVFPASASMPPPPTAGPKHPVTPCPPTSIYPRPRSSALLTLVRETRTRLVEPVLARTAAVLATFPVDSDSEVDTHAPKAKARHSKTKSKHGKNAHWHGQKLGKDSAGRRRRQELAAAIRPRGPGGVFVKREAAALAASASALSPLAAAGSPSNSGNNKKRVFSVPESPANTTAPPFRRRRTSSIPSPMDVDLELFPFDFVQTKRARRPSTRFLDCAAVAATNSRSAVESATASASTSRSASGNCETAGTPSADKPTLPKIKLTIRLPPRAALRTVSASSSMSATTSNTGAGSEFTEKGLHTPPEPADEDEVEDRRSDSDSDEVENRQSDSDEDEDIPSLASGEGHQHVENEDDCMSFSTVTASVGTTSRSRSISRVRSQTPSVLNGHTNGYGASIGLGYAYAGKTNGTANLGLVAAAGSSALVASAGTVDGTIVNGNAAVGKGKAKLTKPRPETFNQPWSVEEQHLLEKLLEDFPDGVRNRWAKISKAMEGKRTPRQVASRVQKYFLKLKKYGVDVMGR